MIREASPKRWAIASFVYVDPRMEQATENDPTFWEGHRELLLFAGVDASDIFQQAWRYGHETEEDLVANSSNPTVIAVRGELGPYVPTRFLGFEEIAWTAEAPGDGAILSLGQFDTQVNEINLGAATKPEWPEASWALVEAVLMASKVCLLLVQARTCEQAAAKASGILQTSEIRSITRMFAGDLYSGCDLLGFPTSHPAAVWRRLIKSNRNLAIATGIDISGLDQPNSERPDCQPEADQFWAAIGKWLRKP